MTPNTGQKIKLTPAMKKVIELMRDNYTLRQGIIFPRKIWISQPETERSFRVNLAAFKSLLKKGIIIQRSKDDNIFLLTELGKTINL